MNDALNRFGQLLALGGAAMAYLLDHFNNNAAAYSVLIGFLGLGITGLYHWRKDRREVRKTKAELEAISRRRAHLVRIHGDKETESLYESN